MFERDRERYRDRKKSIETERKDRKKERNV